MRSNAVKQEVEKNQELVRATLRCLVSLQGLEHSGMLWALFMLDGITNLI